MPRVVLRDWLVAVVSPTGPKMERDRHLCHVLAHMMRGDGRDGCFPGQRLLATMIARDHRTVGASLERLRRQGWLEAEPMRRQFGKIGWRYFPAVPAGNGEHVSPNSGANGERVPQSGNRAAPTRDNGESVDGIGEFFGEIGEADSPESSIEITLKGAAAPSPAPGFPDEAIAAIRRAPRDLSDRALAKQLRASGHGAASTIVVRRLRDSFRGCT